MAENKEPTLDEQKDPTEQPVEEIANKEPETTSISDVEKTEAQGKEQSPAKKPNRFKAFLKTKKGKVICIVSAVVLLLAVLMIIPVTRYAILGTFVKKDVLVVVTDSATKKPVSKMSIEMGEYAGRTDSAGKLLFKAVPVNEYSVKATKKYYKDINTQYTVPVFGNAPDLALSAVATGRQVPVKVVDKISGAVLSNATLTAGESSVVTDEKGTATIVLPADKTSVEATLQREGYNQVAVTIQVTDQPDINIFSMTPSGKIVYLSKQTGKINVMKSNIDGTEPVVIVEGTGNENDRSTSLLASRDWKYAILLTNRTGKPNDQVYVVDIASGQLKLVDEGDASFQLTGWSNHRFIYTVSRNTGNYWDSKRYALKSYDADASKLSVLDENVGTGTNSNDYQYDVFVSPYVLENRVVYGKKWNFAFNLASTTTDKKNTIVMINTQNYQKQTMKEFPASYYASMENKLYAPQELLFRVVSTSGGTPSFYEFENDTVKDATSTDEKFYNTIYPTYLISPSSSKTFWSESRDGKNTLFIGDKNAQNATTLASQSDFQSYGWYSDNYILLSKNGSELYIAPSNQPLNASPLKVTNYHKPQTTYPGYGYGYGGI